MAGGAPYSIDEYYFAALASGLSSLSVYIVGHLLSARSPRRRWLASASLVIMGLIQAAIWGLFVKARKYTLASLVLRTSLQTIQLLTYYGNQSK